MAGRIASYSERTAVRAVATIAADSVSDPAKAASAGIDKSNGTCSATLTAPKSNTVASADAATRPSTASSSGTASSGNCQGVGR